MLSEEKHLTYFHDGLPTQMLRFAQHDTFKNMQIEPRIGMICILMK